MQSILRSVRISVVIGLLFFSVQAQQRNTFQGSIPSGPVSATPLVLGLNDAIQRGLQFNLGLLESQTASDTARAERIQALSALLPQISGTFTQSEEQLNLKTFGFSFAPNPYITIPEIVGPFSFANAQADVSAKILDWNARRNLKSAKANEQASQLSVQNSRDLVVQAVANAYLLVLADASRVAADRAQVETDQALYQRTADQKTAGLAAGIDVLRAQVQLKIQQQILLAQQNQYDKDKLALGRVIGLPPAQRFQLADTLPFSKISQVTEEQALHTALDRRPDYKSAQKMVKAAEESVAAAHAEWYPTVDLSGYYGVSGPSLANSHGVFLVTGALNFNIYTGGRIHADVEKAKAALEQRSDELADLSAQIEFEVRSAFLDLQSSADQVAVAQDNLKLANQTLEQSRDRFTAGVTDNIEVVQAQGSVATANDNLIGALYANNVAKVELAKAMGMAEQGVKLFIEVK